MGLGFDVAPSNYVEKFDQKRSVVEVVHELGLGKALDVAQYYPDAIVIGSDTIVVLDDRQLGKPENAEVAKTMLRQYRNRSHQIITSVAVVCKNRGYQKVGSDVATIFFDGLDESIINEYVATESMYDKAGAYAIQHPIIRPHVLDIQGRIDTIVGLPTNLVAEYLKDFGIEVDALDMTDENSLKKLGFYE